MTWPTSTPQPTLLRTWKGILRQQDVPPLSHVEQQAREELKRRAALQAASLPPLTAGAAAAQVH